MEQITIRLPEDMLESLDDEAEEKGRSRSEHIRDVLASRRDLGELRTEVDRLRREKRQILDQREENSELARYVDEEIEWRKAPITKRIKWWFTGKNE